ncbi:MULTISPECIES: hypothetical protein [Virgibacillus]|uniref:YneQ n=1 Tax=Virgibacillus pantothenticus TaxID=1473 RepID=A0A0L0QNS0_VIRPA|nr:MULTISPECIES: hypothetical protein [Virgibacillus]API94028.1 hypothetical protein BKP57_20705 [Virgibacillus sp. 6R]KNE20280.1 hypothetical protein AFK71_18010 [Virgibacillus pantothenticus]MBS7429398.1 hypothetical protein [Virgibacillus sp. 19R1-5]MBU8568085.1 hypothetical protein [Virgibacillus pantothenticus]MBU8602031.1 hypothetical protein [Virgibacillus pantothenticus]
MAFGISRKELTAWKQKVKAGEVAFLTHFWLDDRFPDCNTVTKAGCIDIQKLVLWGKNYDLPPEWIDQKDGLPHFDLFGEKQKYILEQEGEWQQIERFQL